MIFAIIIFVLWLGIGIVDLVSSLPITKFEYGLCWIVLMIQLLGNIIEKI